MKGIRRIIVCAALVSGLAATAHAGEAVATSHLLYAQLNDPGDGLDGRTAVRQGNARPYRLGGRGLNRLRRHRHGRHSARYHRRTF